MSVISPERTPAAPQTGSEFIVIVDAPHLTIVWADGCFRGRCGRHPLALEVLAEVGRGHCLLIDEVIDPGLGEYEVTFRESGAI